MFLGGVVKKGQKRVIFGVFWGISRGGQKGGIFVKKGVFSGSKSVQKPVLKLKSTSKNRNNIQIPKEHFLISNNIQSLHLFVTVFPISITFFNRVCWGGEKVDILRDQKVTKKKSLS
jgi:hypothetical protein